MGIARRIKKYKAKREQRKLVAQYSANAHPMQFDWDWKQVNYNRIALVNLLISLSGDNPDYLEIGCADNELFDSVIAASKTGVDPAPGGTHRETSDSFFASNTKTFDVVFNDGLHEYQQVRRDAQNSIQCLKPGGWIAFHDFLPRTWKEHHVPRLQGLWTGDCWKLAMELAESEDIDFKILNIDHGVGVMRLKKPNARITDLKDTLTDAQFDYFVDNHGKLPRTDWADGVAWIKSASAH